MFPDKYLNQSNILFKNKQWGTWVSLPVFDIPRRGARTTFPKILRRLHKSVLQKITFLYYLMCRYQYKLRTPFYVWQICNFNPLLQYRLLPVPTKLKLCVTSQTNKSTNFLLWHIYVVSSCDRVLPETTIVIKLDIDFLKEFSAVDSDAAVTSF